MKLIVLMREKIYLTRLWFLFYFFPPLMWSLFCIAFKWCHVAHNCVNLCMLTRILLFVLNIVIMHMSIFSEQVFFLGTNDYHHFWNLHHYLSPKKWQVTLSLLEISKQHIRYRRNRFSWASADGGSHENLCLVYQLNSYLCASFSYPSVELFHFRHIIFSHQQWSG